MYVMFYQVKFHCVLNYIGYLLYLQDSYFVYLKLFLKQSFLIITWKIHFFISFSNFNILLQYSVQIVSSSWSVWFVFFSIAYPSGLSVSLCVFDHVLIFSRSPTCELDYQDMVGQGVSGSVTKLCTSASGRSLGPHPCLSCFAAQKEVQTAVSAWHSSESAPCR